MKKTFTHIRMLIGVVLISSFAATSYAEFNLDKLKGLAEQAKAYQEKLKQGAPSNVPVQTGPSAQSSSDTVQTSETQGENTTTQIGPNILGIRLGMSPTEVQKTIQKLPRLKSFPEKSTLDYLPASGGWKPIPNSEYVYRLQAKVPPFGLESLLVVFTPFAQQERAVSIERQQIFPPDQKPTVETLVSALTEKYGPIAYKRNDINAHYFWRYDANGKPMRGNIDTRNITQNNGCDCAPQPYPNLTSSCPTQKAMSRARENIQKYLLETENCGHTQVHVKFALDRSRPDSPLVNSMTVYLGAWGEAVAARRSADKIRENYGKTAREKEIGEAGKRKLDL